MRAFCFVVSCPGCHTLPTLEYITMPAIIPPNFVSVRLHEDDKQNYAKIQEHMQKLIGMSLSQSDLYRLGIKALAEKHGIKGIR